MDCYNCKFRGTVVGSAHSSCNVIRSTGDEKSGELELLLAAGSVRLTDGEDNPMVELNPHGIKNGWAMWPLDFDPIWVDDCKFFNQK